jgi:hypothetical protein
MIEAHGARTYFFAGYTGGAGMAPGSFIVAISFDGQGRPVPFYVTGYANYNRDGIRDLVDLDGNGPELIQQDWVETHSTPDTRAGYYVTTLYRQRGVYWHRVDGRHGSKTFPLFESWVILPNRRPEEVPAPEQSPGWIWDCGNDPGNGHRTTIRKDGAAGLKAVLISAAN